MKAQTVIVMGNARSGTSMTSGVLSMLGVNMHQKHNPHPQNPKGAFEDVNVIHVTSKMRQDQKNGMQRPNLKEKYGKRVAELIEKRSGLWGFKSALTHHNLDFFLEYAKSPRLIIVFRNPLDNAKSYVIHKEQIYGENITLENALKEVADSTRVLINNTSRVDVPKIYATYERLKTNPIKEAGRFAEFLNIRFTDELKQKVKDFIMPGYSTLNQ